MMDSEASHKLKICDGGHNDGNSHDKWLALCSDMKEPLFTENFEFEDDDDVALLPRLTPNSSLGTCSGKLEASVKKRLFDNSDSLHISLKKSKVSLCDDRDEYGDEDGDLSADRAKRLGKSVDKSFSSLKNGIEFVEKSFEECKRKRREEEKRLESVKREIEECSRELVNKKKLAGCVRRTNEIHNKMIRKIEGCVKDFVAKEAQLCLIEDLIGERKQELRVKEIELRQVINNISKEREFDRRLESQMKGLLDDLLLKQKHFERGTMELELKEKKHEGLVMKWELKERELEGQMKELETKKKHFESQVNELKAKERQWKGRVKEFESKEKLLDGRVKEVDWKESEFEGRAKELESEKKHFESRMKDLESKEKQHESRVKEHDSKKDEFKCRVKELESEKKQFECQLKELESKENQFKEQMKELQLKEEEFKGEVKVFELEEGKFKGRVKELELEKKHFECRLKELESKEILLKEQMKEFQSKEEEFKGQVKVFESKEEEFEGRVKELNSKEKQFEERWKDLESKEKLFEGQVIKNPESKLNKHDEKESATSYMDDESSPPIDETSLQLVSCEQTDIQAILRESSDPAKLVLDIILNPILSICDKKGNSEVIIDDRCIYMLEQLMKISPNIKPHVREEAMKLALDLKANMKENTENSLVVLGFLLILSIYGLVTSFDEDEVLELFASVAQHKIALELFRPLSFAN